MQNRIDAALTAAKLTEYLQSIRTIESEMSFLVDLAREEIRTLPKMGERGEPFVMDALVTAETDDSFLPRSLDVAAMRRDVELLQKLPSLIAVVAHFKELLDDTYILVGSDAYAAALEIYSAAQRHGKGEALTESLRNMSRRFDHKPKETEEPENPEETPQD